MDSKKEKQEEIFKIAVQIEDPKERAALVKDKCGDDNELRDDVESLLLAYDRAGDFLEAPAMDQSITREDTDRLLDWWLE